MHKRKCTLFVFVELPWADLFLSLKGKSKMCVLVHSCVCVWERERESVIKKYELSLADILHVTLKLQLRTNKLQLLPLFSLRALCCETFFEALLTTYLSTSLMDYLYLNWEAFHSFSYIFIGILLTCVLQKLTERSSFWNYMYTFILWLNCHFVLSSCIT